MSILFLWLLLNTEFSDTEIYKPLSDSKVAVTQDGRVFILDRDESRVLSYNKEGILSKTFGRNGEDPGEFNFVIGLNIIETKHDVLCVLDHLMHSNPYLTT